MLLAHFTNKGKEISLRNEQWLKRLRLLLWLGLLEKISAFWSVRELNNWIKDEYVWNREIIVVTGGSDGMGAIMVKLFAEKGIKVCVIDVQPLQYEGRLSEFTALRNNFEHADTQQHYQVSTSTSAT